MMNMISGNKSGMRNITAVLLVLLLAMGLLCSCVDHAVMEEEKTYEGTIEEKVQAFYEDHRDTAAGMQMAVFDQNGVIYQGYYGYSNIEEQIPVDADTVIDWGSSTKTMVWISVMQLWEQGKLDLEADVRTYLPEGFLTNLSYERPVRMLDLMNHRAGFQEYYTDMFLQPDQKYLSLEDALRQDQPPQIFEPDTITAYSNWGVALAGYIVERISGLSFCDYVHQNIFEPLGMENSALAPDLMDNPSVRERRDRLVCYSGTTSVGSAFYLIQLYPAGSCVSTLNDYITYASALIQDTCPLFQDPNTYDVMMTATSLYGNTDAPKNAHGFWALPYGSNTWGHGGNTQACSSYILFDPERQLGAVVMTNQAVETIFNCDMMELIFGESEWNYDTPGDIPSGMLHPARTFLKGHLRIEGESYLSLEEFSDMLWTYNDKDGIPKIENPYVDYYFVSTGEALLHIIVLYGWAAGLAYSLLSLTVKLIRRVVCAIRRKSVEIPLGAWSAVMAGLQLLILLIGVAIVVLLSGWFRASTYVWLFPIIAIIGVILLCMAVYGTSKMVRNWGKMTVIRRIYNGMTIFFAVITIGMILLEQIW